MVGFLWCDNGTKCEYFRSVLFEMNTNLIRTNVKLNITSDKAQNCKNRIAQEMRCGDRFSRKAARADE